MADVTGVSGSYTLPSCGFTEPEGKQFKGWSTSADGSVISGTTYEVSSDTTFYAIWESKEYSIIVTDGKATIGAGSEISKAAQGTTNGFDDGTTELYNAGICVPDFTGELFEEEKDSRIVWAAFARLTPTQKKYVRQHLFGGKTFTRIAKDEGKSIKTVQEAYIAAIKKMKKFLKTPSNLDS